MKRRVVLAGAFLTAIVAMAAYLFARTRIDSDFAPIRSYVLADRRAILADATWSYQIRMIHVGLSPGAVDKLLGPRLLSHGYVCKDGGFFRGLVPESDWPKTYVPYYTRINANQTMSCIIISNPKPQLEGTVIRQMDGLSEIDKWLINMELQQTDRPDVLQHGERAFLYGP